MAPKVYPLALFEYFPNISGQTKKPTLSAQLVGGHFATLTSMLMMMPYQPPFPLPEVV
jgi:hypothetical protein